DITGMLGDVIAEIPEIIAYIQPIIEAIMKLMGTGSDVASTTVGDSSSGLLSLLGSLGSFGAGMAAGGTVGAAGGAAATGAAAAVTPL
ncbi:MAG: hypothetical protein SVE93_04395, partial [Candidatus Thermoplasmatota archaeon]|nr:hypothetical protein [Candidatus Thermoplasmatota archaeon]